MDICRYIETIMQLPDFTDGPTALTMLYECYSDSQKMEDAQTKAAFHALYEEMNGMALRDMDNIIYPVCALCREHQRTGFIGGVKIGILLAHEIDNRNLEVSV